jgi:LysM repeat protein
MIKNCNKFHPVSKTTTCGSIEKYYKLPLSQFLAWNPAVGKDCSGLWANYYVCVSVVGYKPSPTTTAKPTTTKPANGINTPSPIQDGMVKNCEKFHQIKSTTTCSSIESYYNLPLATFLSWNPAVGKDCAHLLTDYWVCIATIGWKPPTKTTTKAATATKPANGISTPTPIQSGMVSNCNKFHMVKSTTTCDSIQNYYKISLADFVKWNPAVGSKCTGLWTNYNVCVGVIGGTPTKPSNGVTTNSPIQSGMVSNCKKFHMVKSTTTCDSIQKYYKITMAQLVKWNTAIGSKCTGLWANYNVCVGV